jgi:hypothetical protein
VSPTKIAPNVQGRANVGESAERPLIKEVLGVKWKMENSEQYVRDQIDNKRFGSPGFGFGKAPMLLKSDDILLETSVQKSKKSAARVPPKTASDVFSPVPFQHHGLISTFNRTAHKFGAV